MVRAITADSDDIPTDQALRELTIYLRNDMISTPTYEVLWERLTDYLRLRHVEKALLVIEHLILHGTKKFIRICNVRKDEFTKLTKYIYKVDGSDIGQNVRRRALVCAELLQREDIQNKTNNFNDDNYGSSNIQSKEKAFSSYDDYFAAADRQDDDIKQQQQLSKESVKQQKMQNEERENGKKKKKKKKKKKSAKKNEFRKQPSAFSSGDEELETDSFPASFPAAKATKRKKKKKKVNYILYMYSLYTLNFWQ